MPLVLSSHAYPQIVIDTNVIVAGLRSRNGSAFRLLGLVGSGQFKINLSAPLVLEYEEVLLRELPNLSINASCDSVVTYDVLNFVNIEQFGVKAVTSANLLEPIGVLS